MVDIAELAGVSRTAVSLILNNRATRIPSETQARVREIADELGFRPSKAALQLRTQKSEVIALIGDEIASGPFAGGLIAGAQRAATAAGHVLMVLNSGTPGNVDSIDVELLEDRQVDGVVYATVMTRPLQPAHLSSAPTVFLNCVTDAPTVGQVVPDDLGGERAAAELALDHGHTRIALIMGEANTLPAEERLRGYREALDRHGVPFDHSLVRFGDWNGQTGYREALDLLSIPDSAPTALLCGNDRIALGAYEAIRSLGLSIPGDVSVIGFDDQREIAEYLHPPLTTIRLPYEEMGARAVETLLAGEAVGTLTVGCEPVLRESLGKVACSPTAD
jgi:LacI family transcriptional regulator